MQIKIGSSWKPVQSGIRLSTSSMLQLHQHLVIEGELKFLMSGRFTQDALENLFSQVRSKGVVHPEPVQFRLSLRLICLAQFMTIPTTGNYEIDDTPHLISFIKSKEQSSKKEEKNLSARDDAKDEEVLRLLSFAASTEDMCESNGFYYAVGWAVYKELNVVNCDNCTSFFTSAKADNRLQKFSSLTEFKSYKREIGDAVSTNFLCHPSKSVFDLLRRCEVIFRSYISEFFNCLNPQDKIISLVQYEAKEFPECHHLENAVLRRYVKLRLNIHAKELSHQIFMNKQYAGKTVARSCIK